MIARVSTHLDASAERTWDLVQKTSTMLYVTRGLLGVVVADDLPEAWSEGARVRCRLLLFQFLPGWVHEARITRLDDKKRELQTAEHGGWLRAWNHTIRVAADGEGTCRYTDAVEIKAGILTLLVWLVAQVFFSYRQMRLRRLLR